MSTFLMMYLSYFSTFTVLGVGHTISKMRPDQEVPLGISLLFFACLAWITTVFTYIPITWLLGAILP